MSVKLMVVGVNFRQAMKDVQCLLDLHDTKTLCRRGRPVESLEVLKRSALILTVTAWETFIEDVITGIFEDRLKAAKSVDDIKEPFLACANSWLYPTESKRKRKPADLMYWTQDNWKHLLKKRFDEELERFHTPKSDNIRKLSKCYAGFDLTLHWKWQRQSPKSACDRLDTLIKRRGKLVHHGKDILSPGDSAKINEVRRGVALIRGLVKCTLSAIPFLRNRK